MSDERVRLVDDFLAYYYESNPVTATFTGVHDYDDRLPDWSAAGLRTRHETETTLVDRLTELAPLPHDAESLRDDPAALDLELVRDYFIVRAAETVSEHFAAANPALWTGEAIFGVVSLMIRDFAPPPDRVAAIRSRLSAVPAFLHTMRTTIRQPIPTLWLRRAVRECRTAAGLFSDGLHRWNEAMGDGAAERAAVEAFSETARWLERIDEEGLDPPALGRPALRALLRAGHRAGETPHQLLARAERAMADARATLAESVANFPGGTWAHVQAAIAADRPSTADYYGTFARRWNEIHDAVVAADIVTWPDWPIRYTPIPEWAREYAPSLYWLFYRSPAPFDPYTTYDYVVTPVDETMPPDVQEARLAAWNHSQITLNHVVHHGGLGHHVQNWHAIHRSTSRVGRIAAVDAASRIGMFSGGSMAEGWACYATGLAGELGLLTPLEALSEQHTAVRLLARCIVDIRMHSGDWPFTECERYYTDVVGMSPEVAAAEATKNSMFPGTALMYWLGTDAIRTARTTLERREGAAFSLKRFHDDLLSRGAIPAPLAARLLTA